MDVFVDDKPISDTAALGAGSIEDALRHAQTNWCPPGRLVVRFRCDGHDIVGESMAKILPRPTASFGRLEVFTATRKSLVLDAMTESATSLRRSEESCQEAAELINQGKAREGVEVLGQCMRAWQQIHLAVTKSIQMLNLDMQTMQIGGEPFEQVITKPRAVLTQIRDALTTQDYVLLADVLQYEFKDVTEQWYAVIARLHEEADALPA